MVIRRLAVLSVVALAVAALAAPSLAEPGRLVIEVDPALRYQTVDGFGASFTDSSTYLIGTQLSPRERSAVLHKLFDPRRGIGLSMMRLPMGASDYTAAGLYSYDDGPADPQLRNFSIAHDRRYTIPVIREALRINPALKIVATPWSPPAWMKTNGSMLGVVGPDSCGQYGPAGRNDDGCDRGALRTDAYGPYARYFVKFVQAYRAAGIPIYAITPVNEPGATPDYPGMIMSPQEEGRFVAGYLGPALRRAHLNVRILGYDWNWTDDDPRYAYLGWTLHGGYVPTLLETPGLRRYLDGISWHGYSGDPARMSAIHAAHPDLPQYELEHSSAVDPANVDALHLAIRSIRNWAKAVITWNLALDGAIGDPGPKIGHGCPGCIGTLAVSHGVARPTKEYAQLAQVARFVRPGAVRIDSTEPASVEDVAFRNPDGSYVLVAVNSGTQPVSVSVRMRHRDIVRDQLAPGAAATFTWH